MGVYLRVLHYVPLSPQFVTGYMSFLNERINRSVEPLYIASQVSVYWSSLTSRCSGFDHSTDSTSHSFSFMCSYLQHVPCLHSINNLYLNIIFFRGSGSWLRAGWSGIESRWGREFPSVKTGPGALSNSCTMGIGSFPGVKCGRGVLLTTHPLLVPRSWKSRAIPLPTLWATRDL